MITTEASKEMCTVEALYSSHHWEPTFTVRCLYNSSTSGMFLGVVLHNWAVKHVAAFSELPLACCTLDGKAKQRLVL